MSVTLAEEIDKIIRIGETDIRDLATVFIQLFHINKTDGDESLTYQNSALSDFGVFLEKYLDEKVLDKNDKIIVVKILDKINIQKELVELKLQGSSIENLKIAAERLGKKSQSAFEQN